ncbi:N-chimaerin-like [Ischnura elegans]|uniref:N-chimaerin-like n=1 Tax=Ischnura elegans TaxID=197161 RepID=UPI001ED8A643|nr:N-chimaerin-like [Ischnura elegans]
MCSKCDGRINDCNAFLKINPLRPESEVWWDLKCSCKSSEKGKTGLDSSPVHPVWKPDLYKLQQEAPKPKPIPCIKSLPYHTPPQYGSEFHGPIGHAEAAQLLDEDGAFLVRESRSHASNQDRDSIESKIFTLSLRYDGKVRHYRLHYDGCYHRVVGGDGIMPASAKCFPSIVALAADGLVTLHLESRAGPYLRSMSAMTSYEGSPYMTLNRLKRRALLSKLDQMKNSTIPPINSSEQLSSPAAKIPRDSSTTSLNASTSSEAPLFVPNQLICYEKHHSFKVHTFKGLNWCEFCGNFLWGFTAQGVKCEDCGFIAHSRCSEKVPNDCLPDVGMARGVFGLELSAALAMETALYAEHSISQPLVPFVVRCCIKEIERRGLDSEGLYRVSGFAEEIEALKMALDKDGERADISPNSFDNINVVAGTLKLYLRLLPIPLITFDAHPRLISAAQIKDPLEQIENMRDAVMNLPPVHFNTLKFLIEHLYRVSEYESENKMTAHNLSTVFAPTLMPAPDAFLKSSSPSGKPLCMGGMLPGMGHEISALECMIINHGIIFSST